MILGQNSPEATDRCGVLHWFSEYLCLFLVLLLFSTSFKGAVCLLFAFCLLGRMFQVIHDAGDGMPLTCSFADFWTLELAAPLLRGLVVIPRF